MYFEHSLRMRYKAIEKLLTYIPLHPFCAEKEAYEERIENKRE